MFVGEMNSKQWIANSLLPGAMIDDVVDANLLGIGTEQEDDDQCEFDLTNERFLVPEMIVLYSGFKVQTFGYLPVCLNVLASIILTGGSTLFPGLADRLEKELRPLVPDDYQVNITPQQDDYTASINRMMWSPDGTRLGKHRCPCLSRLMCVVTCGEDRVIKVWDAVTGTTN
ncbi:unnamed protein product [Prunus brigantina]